MADLLVFGLHVELVRDVATSLGLHFEGLGAAARHLHREQIIDSKLKRRLLEVETAYNVTRHITSASSGTLTARLREDLAKKGNKGKGEQNIIEEEVLVDKFFVPTSAGDSAGEGDATRAGDSAGEGVATRAGDSAGECDATRAGDSAGEGVATRTGDGAGECEATRAGEPTAQRTEAPVDASQPEPNAVGLGAKRRRWTQEKGLGTNATMKVHSIVRVVSSSTCLGQYGRILAADTSIEELAGWTVRLVGGFVRAFDEITLSTEALDPIRVQELREEELGKGLDQDFLQVS